jgi:hypothetical protein
MLRKHPRRDLKQGIPPAYPSKGKPKWLAPNSPAAIAGRTISGVRTPWPATEIIYLLGLIFGFFRS